MKKFIQSNMEQTNNSIIVECACGCGFLKVMKFDDKTYDIQYFSDHNMKKHDRFAWDILMDEEQFNNFYNALTELKNV